MRENIEENTVEKLKTNWSNIRGHSTEKTRENMTEALQKKKLQEQIEKKQTFERRQKTLERNQQHQKESWNTRKKVENIREKVKGHQRQSRYTKKEK